MKKTGIGVALLVGASFAAGWMADGLAPSPALAQGSDRAQTYKYLELFDSVLHRVSKDYVDPVSSRTLIYNALNGMLTGLDPHSAYMTPQQWHDMQTETTGRFGGVGLEVTDAGGLLQVVSPIDGTPAAAAGVKSGDLITAVNGKTVEGMSLNDAVSAMRGPADTKVQLTIKRIGVDDPIVLNLVRQIIHVPTVKSQLIGNVGVIRISEFTEQTDPGVKAALKSLRAKAGGHLDGLILDLRNNPGGLLEQAIAVSNDFLSSGKIVSTHGRHADDDDSWSAQPGEDIAGKLPVVILTNNGTASAAEIVSGALQDNKRAVILGTRTFGKGSVQTIFPLPGNGAIRLTTARYYTPDGRSIQGLGITPNVVVEETRKPVPHFGPAHEADLRHILSNPDGKDATAPKPPDVPLPPMAKEISRLPPKDWPKYDPAKPSTDYQLQQGLTLVRAMASVKPAGAAHGVGTQAASR